VTLNILFVHEVDWSTKVVFDMHSLSELLAIFGHNVFVIDFPSLRNRRRLLDFGSLKTEEFKNVAGRAHSCSPVTLIRPGFIKAPFLDRASAFFTHYLAIEKAVKDHHIDAIVLYSVPTNGLQTVKLAKKNGIPVFFRSIDILHELVPYWFLSPLTFSLETWVYNHVDKILTLSPKLSEYVIRMDANEDNVELLLFGVDLTKFNTSVDSAELKKRLGIAEQDLVVLYVGTLFEFSGLDLYLEQFSQVVKSIHRAKLIIVGEGALFRRLKELVRDYGLAENVILTGFQPFDMMPQYINMANICINPFEVNGATSDIVPGKILQYLACGKPVLATPLPGMVSLLEGPKNGLFFSRIDEFAKNTVKLLKNPKMAESLGEKGYQYVRNNHDELQLAHRLEAILNEKTKKHKGAVPSEFACAPEGRETVRVVDMINENT